MAGRTTLIIAHRLSTIALADEIVVLEDGEIAARGNHAELLERLGALPRDRREGPARQRVPDAQAARARGGGPVRTRAVELLAAAARHARSRRGGCAASPRCSRPTARRVALMLGSLVVGTAAALAPAPLAKLAIDDGIIPRQPRPADADRRRVRRRRAVVWAATAAQTYLVEWVGQRALADLRLAIFDQLQRLPVSFYERRPAGVLISRMTNDVEALDSLVTDSVVTLFQGGLTLIGTLGDPDLPRPAPRADHVRDGARDRDRLADLPDRLGGRLPAHARDDRRDHRLPAGVALGRARRAHVRPGAAPRGGVRGRSTSVNRAANMRTVNLNAAYFPAIEFVSAVATVVVLLYGGSQVLDGAIKVGVLVGFLDGAVELLQPDHPALAALHDLPGGDGRARQDLRAARRAAGDGRARPTRVSSSGSAASCASTTSASPTRGATAAPRASRSTTSICRSPPARPSRWSARPAPASRPSRSSSRASTTRPPGAC